MGWRGVSGTFAVLPHRELANPAAVSTYSSYASLPCTAHRRPQTNLTSEPWSTEIPMSPMKFDTALSSLRSVRGSVFGVIAAS